MESKFLNYIRQTPAIIWGIRMALCGVAFYAGNFFAMSMENGPLPSKLALGGFVAMNIVGVTASFIRSKISLIVFTCCILAIPVTLFIPLDIFMIKGTWYERCLAWTVAVLEQMLIPLSIAFYIWKAPKVRSFYTRGD